MLYSLMKHVIVGPALKTLYTPHVEGIEHIPEDGPAILASNHLCRSPTPSSSRWSSTGRSRSWPRATTSTAPGSGAG